MDKNLTVTEEVLAKINRFAVAELKAEQVYCFSVLLCDNDIDRDGERFSKDSLAKLAELFIGRTGIFDHDPRGANQTARIFDTDLREDTARKTAAGESYCALMGYAYMVRTEDNRSLIAEIDGGIKKEVSVGCSVARKICSVCGRDILRHSCSHKRGRTYGGKLCYITLEDPTDAYEWSFVAVPAQRSAGVTKKHKEGGEGFSDSEHERLSGICECACEELISDIVKLSYFTKPYRDAHAVKSAAEGLDFYGLLDMKNNLAKEVREISAQGSESFITAAEDTQDNDVFRV